MPNRLSGISQTSRASSAAGNVELSHLLKTNPRLPQLIKEFPGLGAFLAQLSATSCIAAAADGAVTEGDWSAWFHSPASLHHDYNWQDQFVFVFQRGAGDNGTLDFGYDRYRGRLIGVHRLGDLDVPVRRVGRYDGGTAGDHGFETLMPVAAVGRAGSKREICFCVGSLDNRGNPVGGWGYLGGYAGRQHDIVLGKPFHAPIHEDYGGGLTVLTPKPGGGFSSHRV